MVTYNGLVKRGQRVPETPSLWEAIMSTKTTEFSTTYFTDKFGHDYYVRVYNFETSGISAKGAHSRLPAPRRVARSERITLGKGAHSRPTPRPSRR